VIEEIMMCRQYIQPKTIQEAITLLKHFDGEARIIAGGTDLMIDLKTEKKKAAVLVDISRIGGVDAIRVEGENLRIGARVTHSQVSRSEFLRKNAPVLPEACSTIGSPQIRNMGTLVGNIVNAMPAADGATALIALGARVNVIGCNQQERFIPLEQLYQGPGRSVIDSTREFIPYVEFSISGLRSGSSFQRLARRKALALPVLNAAVFIRIDETFHFFEEARIVMGPVSPIPFRPKGAESILSGSPVNGEVIRRAGEIASGEASPRTSLRGGKEYRREMVKVLVDRGLKTALSRVHPKFSDLK
jgi:CO/xanthine dehydrogenase FAD-binding subunit